MDQIGIDVHKRESQIVTAAAFLAALDDAARFPTPISLKPTSASCLAIQLR